MRLVRIAALFFGLLAVGAFAASIGIAEVDPDQSEGWGLLFALVAFMAGPFAVLCGLIVGIRVYRVHQTRVGATVMVIVGAVLLLWLARTLFAVIQP